VAILLPSDDRELPHAQLCCDFALKKLPFTALRPKMLAERPRRRW
jgi:hypothetical protein